jgi:hypothetical protein
MVGGMLGGLTIAIWFLVVDSLNGRPFYTPSLLGTALFRSAAPLDNPQTLAVSFEMVMMFTWIHFLIFCALGALAGRLLEMAEHTANVGFGLVLLFVFLEVAFVVVLGIIADDALQALAWPSVFVGNLLAATVMALYFWRIHPNLVIEP